MGCLGSLWSHLGLLVAFARLSAAFRLKHALYVRGTLPVTRLHAKQQHERPLTHAGTTIKAPRPSPAPPLADEEQKDENVDGVWAALSSFQDSLHGAWSEAQRSLNLPLEHYSHALEPYAHALAAWGFKVSSPPPEQGANAEISGAAEEHQQQAFPPAGSDRDETPAALRKASGRRLTEGAAAAVSKRFHALRAGARRLRSVVWSAVARQGQSARRLAVGLRAPPPPPLQMPQASSPAEAAAAAVGSEAPLRSIDVMTGSKADAKFKIRPPTVAWSPLWTVTSGASYVNVTSGAATAAAAAAAAAAGVATHAEGFEGFSAQSSSADGGIDSFGNSDSGTAVGQNSFQPAASAREGSAVSSSVDRLPHHSAAHHGGPFGVAAHLHAASHLHGLGGSTASSHLNLSSQNQPLQRLENRSQLSPEHMPAAAVAAATRTPPLPPPPPPQQQQHLHAEEQETLHHLPRQHGSTAAAEAAPPIGAKAQHSTHVVNVPTSADPHITHPTHSPNTFGDDDEPLEVYAIPPPKHMEITINQRPLQARSGSSGSNGAKQQQQQEQTTVAPGDWSAQGERVLRLLRLEQHRRRAIARTRELTGSGVEPRVLEAACGAAAAVPSKQAAQQFAEQIGLPRLLQALAAPDSGPGVAPPLASMRGLARLVQISASTAKEFSAAAEADAVLSRLTATIVAPLGPTPTRAARVLTASVTGAVTAGVTAVTAGLTSGVTSVTSRVVTAGRRGRAEARKSSDFTSFSPLPPPRSLAKFPAKEAGGSPAPGTVYPKHVPRADFRSIGIEAIAADEAVPAAVRAQAEAVKLLYSLAMASDAALKRLQQDKRLVSALRQVANGGYAGRFARYRQGQLTPVQRLSHKLLAAMGLDQWVPKSPRQRGLRILCLDGGGTRGVLSIQLLKQLVTATGKEPTECFDLIMGTSTGGIIAGLVGFLGYNINTCEQMYDALIPMIFQKHPGAGVKLALRQAYYDEANWMGVLQRIVGDLLLIDTADDPLRPKVACPSTVISSNPAKLWLWRNYNYSPDSQGRYSGSFRHMVRECVRATTAAPTFFSPLMLGGALYSDGALMANNPTCVALHEAAHIFPNVPVEAVVSLGTGCFNETARDFSDPNVGWDSIVNQLIGSATETENTHDMLTDLLPPEKYFRFNPKLPIEFSAIDETRPDRLRHMKSVVAEYFAAPDNAARLDELSRILKR